MAISPLPKKQVLKYKRADGVDLSANLYLPPGYKTGRWSAADFDGSISHGV